MREKLQQAAPQVAATAAPGASPETAVAAPGSGAGAATEVLRSELRAEAPPFVPRAAFAKPSGGLRASAPVFVPQASTVARGAVWAAGVRSRAHVLAAQRTQGRRAAAGMDQAHL